MNPERPKDLDGLTRIIAGIDERLASRAKKAVNVSLTARNWLIGLYISEYELHGEDRSEYGRDLFRELARRLTALKVSNCNRRQLYRYLNLYRTYPDLLGPLTPEFGGFLPIGPKPGKVGTPSPLSEPPPRELLLSLSYSHLELLTAIEDSVKRGFYESMCMRALWSVKELRRQVDSLYYERSYLSGKPDGAVIPIRREKAPHPLTRVIQDPYVFEFLGLRPREVMGESALEDGLLDRLQQFLLELGYGFCFESRQKRIVIDDEHFFVDMVFYHRVIKCHVLVELKVDGFRHEHLGQLNTYVNWYRHNEMTPGDNPPVGLLLCTRKNRALVEYATAGMDNRMFVSKYQLALPKKKELCLILEEEMSNI